MSAEVAQSLGEVVRHNVRRWRLERGLDQQGLADRLAELGWKADRTAIVKIEQGKRKVPVNDLGLLAVALNVPLPVLMLPILDGADVQLTPASRSAAVNRWWLFETMLGNESYPGRWVDRDVVEFELGAMPLRAYNLVRRAQREADAAWGSEDWLERLQSLVDAVDAMERLGWPARDLIGMFGYLGEERHKAIEQNGIRPAPGENFEALGQAAEKALRRTSTGTRRRRTVKKANGERREGGE